MVQKPHRPARVSDQAYAYINVRVDISFSFSHSWTISMEKQSVRERKNFDLATCAVSRCPPQIEM
jgi:hypothetical protein